MEYRLSQLLRSHVLLRGSLLRGLLRALLRLLSLRARLVGQRLLAETKPSGGHLLLNSGCAWIAEGRESIRAKSTAHAWVHAAHARRITPETKAEWIAAGWRAAASWIATGWRAATAAK
jgi:hypothetical protein